jgi:hypothetical protein
VDEAVLHRVFPEPSRAPLFTGLGDSVVNNSGVSGVIRRHLGIFRIEFLTNLPELLGNR